MTPAERTIADTRRWLERAVIGLNLCPFAKAVTAKGQVHFAATGAEDAAGILRDLDREMQALVAAPPQERDTTLLVIPRGMEDFLAFNDLVARAERLVRKRGLEGVLQVASFHPRFTFAGTDEDDITNFTNRAPHPTLHLLREESLDRAVEAFPDAADIYERNMDLLRRIGPQGWEALDVGPTK
jgi:hypothetical protein